MEKEIKIIEARIQKLENVGRSKLRFVTQYLISPVLVVVIGVIINWQIEQDRKEVQQIKIAQSMLTTLFSEDEFKTMATQRLMDEVLQDESLKVEMGKIISDYMKSKFMKSANDGDYEKAANLYEAVKAVGGETGARITAEIEGRRESKSVLSKYQIAKSNETKGFSALVAENYAQALESFKTSYEVYPRYHSVAEIYHLLVQNKDNMNNPQTKEKVIKKILKSYSWKAPQELISRLKNSIEG